MLLLAVAVVFAQEPPLEPVDAGLNEEGVYEVRVYADDLRDARREVFDALEAQGWRQARRRGDETVFKGPKRWMGKARVSDEGLVRFGRPLLVVSFAQQIGTGPRGEPAALAPTDMEAVARDGGRWVPTFIVQVPGKKKVDAVQQRLAASIEPELAAYRGVLQSGALREMLQALPGRLDVVWELGIPLDGRETVLETPAERRREVLDYWATRTATPEGAQVCAEVELWLERVVQTSADPVTAAEQALANERATHGRTLHLAVPAPGPGLAAESVD